MILEIYQIFLTREEHKMDGMDGKKPEIGMIDISGREILHVIENPSERPGGRNLTILMNKKGNLEIANIYSVKRVIARNMNALVFHMPCHPKSFSLKGAGKEYHVNGDDNYSTSYIFNHDAYQNMIITPKYKKQLFSKLIFLTKLQSFIVKRKRDRKRKENNADRNDRNDTAF